MGKYEKTIYGKRWVSDKEDAIDNSIGLMFWVIFLAVVIVFNL